MFICCPNNIERLRFGMKPYPKGSEIGCNKIDLVGDREVELLVFETESKMLNAFLSYIIKAEIDILSGFNSHGFDDMYIYNRCKLYSNVMFSLSNLGIFKRFKNAFPMYLKKVNARGGILIIDGISSCDIMQLVKSLYSNLNSYSLKNVCSHFLKGIGKYDLPYTKMKEMFEGGYYINDDGTWNLKKDMEEIAYYCMIDTFMLYQLDIKLELFDFIEQLSNLCRISLNDCTGGQMIRVSAVMAQYARLDNIYLDYNESDLPNKKLNSYHGALVC